MAPAVIYHASEWEIPQNPAQDPEGEVERFQQARQKVLEQIQRMQEEVRSQYGDEGADIFEAHYEILNDDEAVGDEVCRVIRREKKNAAAAVAAVFDEIAGLMSRASDPYLRERAADCVDIKAALLDKLLGAGRRSAQNHPREFVLVAGDLTPSDTAKLPVEHVAAIVTERGGTTSHAAILTRLLNIPAVVGVKGILEQAKEGEMLIVDGTNGTVVLSPTEEEAAEYRLRKARFQREQSALGQYLNQPTRTADGRRVMLGANVGLPEDARNARQQGAELIGLVRSEFLYLDVPELPGEEEQLRQYTRIMREMQGGAVYIRTLDVGGDKPLAAIPMPREENPFLGQRAIRLCLAHRELFLTQLRALLRASCEGDLGIMFPMISSLAELREAKAALEEAKGQLDREGLPWNPECKVGMMIEIPSAALMADAFAQEADFFSIGTNDLTQYVLACDRTNEAVAPLYTHRHPAVLRLIADTISAAARHGIPCGMCGEAAGDLRFLPLLLGMGLTEFSMSASRILPARKAIAGLNWAECGELAQRALSCKTAQEVEALLESAALSPGPQ